ncbi:MAG: hypothetical protein MUE36_14450 [Acidimicrobiales bacterium]|nr:hypothetical protein [Acidimicrobiales bacterium]
MHPAERVRFVTETARAVLGERLGAVEGATAVRLQAEQLAPLLRSDRDEVTRAEAESVATQLRLLAEQVNDKASGRPDNDAYLAIAASIGALGQALR